MTKSNKKKLFPSDEAAETTPQINRQQKQLRLQQRIANAARIFQDDVTARTLLESLAEGVIAINHNGTIVLINERTEEIFGYSRDEAVGRSLGIVLPEQYVKVHNHYMGEYFSNPRVRPMGQGFDLLGKRKDGTEFPVEVSLSFLETETELLGLAFITDITRRKAAEKTLKQQNEALDAFAHMVAHDLGSSLVLMIGYSEILLEDFQAMPPEDLRNHLATIAQSGHKMNDVIRELLLMAHIRKEDVKLHLLDMGRIVDEALQRLQHQIKESGAEIVLPNSYPAALGYAPWVEEVWFNYISNALKYGGQPPRLELGGTPQKNGYVQFWVKDNGAGLTAEQQKQLFDPLTRSKKNLVKGSGLGLSIVQRILEKLGGQVTSESEVGKGSVFSFTLPGPE